MCRIDRTGTATAPVLCGGVWRHDLEGLLTLDDTALQQLLFGDAASRANSDPRWADLEGRLDYLLKELRRTGVAKHLLWQEYRASDPPQGGYSYSQFCYKECSCIVKKFGATHVCPLKTRFFYDAPNDDAKICFHHNHRTNPKSCRCASIGWFGYSRKPNSNTPAVLGTTSQT